jgi:hypothetical protein
LELHKETNKARKSKLTKEKNEKLLKEFDKENLHQSLDKDLTEFLIEYFKNIPGALGEDSPIVRILIQGQFNSKDFKEKEIYKSRSALKELTKAYEFECKGLKAIVFSNKYPISQEQSKL